MGDIWETADREVTKSALWDESVRWGRRTASGRCGRGEAAAGRLKGTAATPRSYPCSMTMIRVRFLWQDAVTGL